MINVHLIVIDCKHMINMPLIEMAFVGLPKPLFKMIYEKRKLVLLVVVSLFCLKKNNECFNDLLNKGESHPLFKWNLLFYLLSFFLNKISEFLQDKYDATVNYFWIQSQLDCTKLYDILCASVLIKG